jgi:hypothetical protein
VAEKLLGPVQAYVAFERLEVPDKVTLVAEHVSGPLTVGVMFVGFVVLDVTTTVVDDVHPVVGFVAVTV